MKKRRNIIKNYNHFKKEKKWHTINYFLITIFIVGFFSGTTVSYELNSNNLLSVVNDVTLTVNNLTASHSVSLLLKSFFTHFIYIFAIWFLSFTIIGIILVIFIVFFIGFMYGLVISSFIFQLGIQGFVLGFFYTFPQNIIIIPLLIYISSNSILLSLSIIKNFYQSNNQKMVKNLLNDYYNQLILAIGVLIIYALIVTIFSEHLIKLVKSIA